MAFNIGSILGGLGTVFAGPVGGAIGSIGGALIERNQQKIAAKRQMNYDLEMARINAQAGRQGLPGVVSESASTAGLLPLIGAAGRVLGGRIGAAAGGAGVASALLPSAETGGQIKPILAIARANMGQPVTSRKIVGLIRQFGWEVVSDWTGLSTAQLMTLWTHVTRRRRTRWTARDRSRARRYIASLQRAEKELNRLRPARRRSTSRSRSSSNITNVK